MQHVPHSKYIQYPSDTRYIANAFHTRKERVSLAKRTRFSPRSNAFHSRSERVSVLVRTRFTREANAFQSTFERVLHVIKTRFSLRSNAFPRQLVFPVNAFQAFCPRSLLTGGVAKKDPGMRAAICGVPNEAPNTQDDRAAVLLGSYKI